MSTEPPCTLSANLCPPQNLKFTNTIRYESRKELASARPRVKGQFVTQKGLAQLAMGCSKLVEGNHQGQNDQFFQVGSFTHQRIVSCTQARFF